MSARAKSIVPPRRWKNGNRAVSRAAKQIEAHQKALEEAEMRVVLAQPHRLGSRSQKRENALGRFCEDNRLIDELYRAGTEYGALRRKWQAVSGAPLMDRLGGSGADIPWEVVHAWKQAIDRCEMAVLGCRSIDQRAYGPAALGYVAWLCCDGKEFPQNGDWMDAVAGLVALALELGHIDQKLIDRRGINSAFVD
ncbi:hypothetical protein C4587_00760 [Candidatus Parcubacteria bacterium]|nr:MAG: hypothetical protein C4587_00760 [Candidatus Parcubacteria bacterium]